MAPERGEPTKKVAEEEDDEDNVPIALSRSKLGKRREPPRKREPEEEDEDNRPLLSLSKAGKKKPGAANGGGPVKVKKEEAEEEEEEEVRKVVKKEMISKKKGDGKGNVVPTKVKKEEPTKVKKEEPNGAVASEGDEDEEYEEDAKQKKKKKMIKRTVVHSKKVVKKVTKVVTQVNGRKKEKKVYDLPGQKHDTPEERDPLRIFYETLYQQVPNSEMAQFWMMEYGLLPSEVAEKIYEKKLKKNQQSKLNSPIKTVSTNKTMVSTGKAKLVSASRSVMKKATKRKIASTSSDEDDDDFISPKKKLKKQKVSS